MQCVNYTHGQLHGDLHENLFFLFFKYNVKKVLFLNVRWIEVTFIHYYI